MVKFEVKENTTHDWKKTAKKGGELILYTVMVAIVQALISFGETQVFPIQYTAIIGFGIAGFKMLQNWIKHKFMPE